VFNQVPGLYDRTRPAYPDALFADLAELAGLGRRSRVLEVGCGTGQATRSLASLGGPVTAVEPGDGLAALARQRLAAFGNVRVESSTFEDWDDRGRRFDVLVAASSWHWVDPAAGWPKARGVLSPGGWMALLGNVTVRRPGEPETYAETADLHERFAPGNPSWGHPPLEEEVRAGSEGWGPAVADPGALFGPTTVRWYPLCCGSTGRASRISSARSRSTAGSAPTSASPCWMRSPSASARGWTTVCRAAT
jgi:SAM-dependent methyltransferase